jgi:hypothetical protein
MSARGTVPRSALAHFRWWCGTECARQTFRRQVLGLIEQYQQRTVRLGNRSAGSCASWLAGPLPVAASDRDRGRARHRRAGLLGIPLPDQG